ncbi:DUF2285 domain-containing protein [Bradyrhizobium genosp. P]|uniref:DUF2285 domain-containing protein n=1 Tax=Bradyrhizobium genosp. P TaxID=83641 RepID=UPI003CF5EEAD
MASTVSGGIAFQPLLDLAAGQARRASDGWHAVLRIGVADHRVWLKELPVADANCAAQLPFDRDFDARAHAAQRLWRAINERAVGTASHGLSKQRCERLCVAIRALDAREAGGTYRIIAEALFGRKRIPDRAWKTHDLRSRTIRLVQSALALMRGGYRELLRPRRKDK